MSYVYLNHSRACSASCARLHLLDSTCLEAPRGAKILLRAPTNTPAQILCEIPRPHTSFNVRFTLKTTLKLRLGTLHKTQLSRSPRQERTAQAWTKAFLLPAGIMDRVTQYICDDRHSALPRSVLY